MVQSENGNDAIAQIAKKHGFGTDAASVLARAIAAGNGTMAQFSHPELGGQGQWTRGGMLMIGDMFNDELKGRVRALADDLATNAPSSNGDRSMRADAGDERSVRETAGSGAWWPADLGTPSSSGSQNGQRYAVFPEKRRLVVERDGRAVIYETGDHRIGGVSQQQSGTSDLSFTSQLGTIRESDLRDVSRD